MYIKTQVYMYKIIYATKRKNICGGEGASSRNSKHTQQSSRETTRADDVRPPPPTNTSSNPNRDAQRKAFRTKTPLFCLGLKKNKNHGIGY